MEINFIGIITVLICIAISSFANSEMDTIAYRKSQIVIDKKYFKKIFVALFGLTRYVDFRLWYIENRWQTKSIWLKTIFSFLLDGWHFMKGLRVYFFSVPIGIALLGFTPFLEWYYSFLFAIPVYAIHGAFFEIFFNDSVGI